MLLALVFRLWLDGLFESAEVGEGCARRIFVGGHDQVSSQLMVSGVTTRAPGVERELGVLIIELCFAGWLRGPRQAGIDQLIAGRHRSLICARGARRVPIGSIVCERSIAIDVN